MSVADVYSESGAECRVCRTSALVCQREFQASTTYTRGVLDKGSGKHCCRACKIWGASAMHRARQTPTRKEK